MPNPTFRPMRLPANAGYNVGMTKIILIMVAAIAVVAAVKLNQTAFELERELRAQKVREAQGLAAMKQQELMGHIGAFSTRNQALSKASQEMVKNWSGKKLTQYVQTGEPFSPVILSVALGFNKNSIQQLEDWRKSTCRALSELEPSNTCGN